MALYCTSELDRFAEIKGGERIRTNMIHRLMIIFLEDVGLGNFELWGKLTDLFDILLVERTRVERNTVNEIRALEKIVRNLCKSNKTRACSFMNCITQMIPGDEEMVGEYYYRIGTEETPEDCLASLDEHLLNKHWKSIFYLKKLIYEKPLKKRLLVILEKYFSMNLAKRWMKHVHNKLGEHYLLYMLPLGNYLYGSIPLQFDDTEIDYDVWVDRGVLKLDEFVYDKHTSAALDRTTEYFVKVSSQVFPEVFIVPVKFKQLYEWARCGKKLNVVKKETDYKFLVRAQLVTSGSKTDTYYATHKGDVWFVKGPFYGRKEVDDFIEIQAMKKIAGLTYIEDAKCVEMVADRWDETPIGIRNILSKTKALPFLICKSFYSEEELEQWTIPHGSLKWPVTNIIDMTAFKIQLPGLTGVMLIDYVKLIAFRMKHNIGDLADRNFIKYKGRLYSVDESYTKKSISLLANLKKKKYDAFKNTCEDLLTKGEITLLEYNFMF